MTFLQPILLIALPLMILPILIHLINRQRHRTIAWGAMMFLLDAKRLTRGMARLRHWLIMAMRMLAIAALIFTIARPLASGRLGLALGGTPDTTIILLDRSASMQQQDVQSGETKRSAALHKLSELLQTTGRTGRIVLIENGSQEAIAIDSPSRLPQLPAAAATDIASDIPALLQTALDYVVANQTGRTDIWICSDMRASDWKHDDGRWTGLREGFVPLEGVRFYILSYPDHAPQNLTVWVDSARVAAIDQTTQLVLDVTVQRPAGSSGSLQVPLEFVINQARSVINLEMNDIEYRLQGHTLALDGQSRSGWGYVELPADANLHDNRYYFVFGDAPQRHTVIVSDDARGALALQIAASSPVDPALSYTAEVLTSQQLDLLDWDKASLILWQVPLPANELARDLESFVHRGRPVLLFPPLQPGDNSWGGFRWGSWESAAADQPWQVQSWRGDSDLLQHTINGAPLPVGKLQIYRYCAAEGEGQALATLANGVPLLKRVNLGTGAFYCCATLPGTSHSSLLRDGVVFYVLLHRALAAGAATHSNVRQLSAGTEAASAIASWTPLSTPPPDALSADRALFAGAFQQQVQLAALNRPPDEDRLETLDAPQLDQLFQGVPYRHVKEEIGSTSALASEIWRLFVCGMALALIVEAVLCLPQRTRESSHLHA